MEYILEILGRIGFDWQVALANLVNFLIIYWLLQRFAFKPIKTIIDQRQAKIAEGLDQAKNAETELMMAQQKAEEIISDAKQEANVLVAKAKERGDVMVSEASLVAERAQEDFLAKGKAELEREREKAREELKKETATLISSGVKKILGRTITPEQDETITKEAIEATA